MAGTGVAAGGFVQQAATAALAVKIAVRRVRARDIVMSSSSCVLD
jgi:hypothetical protein